jgi:hypothetical protein
MERAMSDHRFSPPEKSSPPERARISSWNAADTEVRTYLVVERHPGSGTAFLHELTLPGFTRDDIVRDLIDCQWDEPHKVLLVDEAGGICRNVTAEIAEAVVDHAGANGDTLHDAVFDFAARALQPHPVPESLRRAA